MLLVCPPTATQDPHMESCRGRLWLELLSEAGRVFLLLPLRMWGVNFHEHLGVKQQSSECDGYESRIL